MNKNNLEFHQTLQEWAVLFARHSIQDFLRFAREYHLSMSQINVLMRLYYSGPSTILQLRGDMAGSRAAASQMIDELVRNSWIERAESSTDRRVKSVSLTAEGRQLVEQGIAARRKWLGELAETLPPQQREEIERVLKMMIEAVVKLESAAPRGGAPGHPPEDKERADE